jgi:type IV pilus assembly protein PilM
MFFEIFPPPHVLRMRAAGVHVSDRSVRLIMFHEHGHGTTVEQYLEIHLEKGIVDHGVIQDGKKFAAALRLLFEKSPTEYIYAALPEEQTYLYRTHIPATTPDEMRTAVEFTIQENVPLAADEAVFDFAATSYEPNSQINVSVVVAPRKVVESYTTAFAKAGFVLLSLNAESQAVVQSHSDVTDHDPTLTIAFSSTKTIFALTQSGVVQFSSAVRVDGGSITDIIEKNFNLDRATARAKKHEMIAGTEAVPEELALTVLSSLSVIKDEIDKLLNYWRSYSGQGGEKNIKKIVLVGDDALFPGVSAALADHAKIPAEVGNVWSTSYLAKRYVPAIPRTDALNYAAAIGLARQSLLIHNHV